MMRITANLVKELRLKTGIGIIDCKNALIDSKGDFNKAIILLKKNGSIKAEQKNKNTAIRGIVELSIQNNIGYMIELNCETEFVEKNVYFINFSKDILKTCFKNNIQNLNVLRSLCENDRINLVSRFNENIIIRNMFILNSGNIFSYLHGNKIGVLVSTNSLDKVIMNKISMHIAASHPDYLSQEDISPDILNHEKKIQFDIAINSGKSNTIAKKIVCGKINKFIQSVCLLEQNFVMDPEIKIKDLLYTHNIKIFKFIRCELGEII